MKLISTITFHGSWQEQGSPTKKKKNVLVWFMVTFYCLFFYILWFSYCLDDLFFVTSLVHLFRVSLLRPCLTRHLSFTKRITATQSTHTHAVLSHLAKRSQCQGSGRLPAGPMFVKHCTIDSTTAIKTLSVIYKFLSPFFLRTTNVSFLF